jgi:hypothetical protein
MSRLPGLNDVKERFPARDPYARQPIAANKAAALSASGLDCLISRSNEAYLYQEIEL